MFPIMIYRDHLTGAVVSRFFTFSNTDKNISSTEHSPTPQHELTETRSTDSRTGGQASDREDSRAVSNSGSGSDLGSDMVTSSDLDVEKFRTQSQELLHKGTPAKPLVALYESDSSGSEGSVVAVGIMETLKQIRA